MAQNEILIKIKDRINVFYDENELLQVSVLMQDPKIAAILTDSLTSKLSKYLLEYKTKKAKQDLYFAKNNLDEGKNNYYKIQMELANFRDENHNIFLARKIAELEQLQQKQSIAYNVYNLLAQQYEQAKIKLQDKTPVFTVIEPPMVPLKKYQPKGFFILFSFILIGLFVVIFYIVIKENVKSKLDKYFIKK
jgi:capsule polysaccharide export protein KpsE/RkpR